MCIKAKASYKFLKTEEFYQRNTAFCNLVFPVFRALKEELAYAEKKVDHHTIVEGLWQLPVASLAICPVDSSKVPFIY